MSALQSLRWLFALHAIAIGGVASVVVLALGTPVVLRGGITPGGLAVIAVGTGGAAALATIGLLFRGVARPIDRLVNAATRFAGQGGHAGDLPVLGDPSERGPVLTRSAIAFERLIVTLEAERHHLAAKVAELTATNRALGEARESLLRSEKLATIGRLAAGLAHEVGNPLGAVRGYVDLARSRLPAAPDPELIDSLDRIDSAARRIDHTVRDLLDFARPAPSIASAIDLARVVDASVRLAAVQDRFKAVEVVLDVPADLPRVMADEHQLSQVMLNLLFNAGDSMCGTGRVSVRARAVEEHHVVLAVEDTGQGIAPADLPRVFDPFFTTKEPGSGTGLGLAISHRIVESFGGEITARNAASGGALFELRLRGARTLVSP